MGGNLISRLHPSTTGCADCGYTNGARMWNVEASVDTRWPSLFRSMCRYCEETFRKRRYLSFCGSDFKSFSIKRFLTDRIKFSSTFKNEGLCSHEHLLLPVAESRPCLVFGCTDSVSPAAFQFVPLETSSAPAAPPPWTPDIYRFLSVLLRCCRLRPFSRTCL